ncbi:MAG: tetratricopeptide repeat protein [Pseudomonas sp.]|uniref:tetratricopeptide repeat protein n=1 Tax=Pseudomonas sp. TaxID=306 RepID=UPI0027337F13|nr:tetratricopeptide repeat protein [Pseudomonas sp.]MDP3846804.1 tetratricopeptide repeat protein [Pseudomonas sp.]
MKKTFTWLIALAFISGCQTLKPQNSPSNPPVAETPAPPSTPLVYGSFSEQSLLALLTAELAGQRNRYDLALDGYLAQAKLTQDAGVAERAFRIAEYLGADQAAQESSLIWAKNAPNNLDAQRAAAIQLAHAGRYEQSMQHMEKVLQAQGDTNFDFLALSAAETDQQTRTGLLQSFDRLLLKHPENSQLLFGKALLLQQDGKTEAALALLEEHPASSEDVPPLLLRVRFLQVLQRSDEALPLLEDGIKLHPDDKRLRLTYARLLVEQERLDDARVEFASLVQQFPDDDDLRLSLALVCLEGKDWQEAQVYLEELIARGSHLEAAHFNLGRVYEERHDPESALIEYDLVGPGNDFLGAQLRQTEILLSGKRVEEASNRLAKARERQPDYAIQLYLIETEALTNHDQSPRAWQTIQQALLLFPDDLNLLYTRAMLAEKRNDLSQLETDLRFILKREPNNAMALNALGYTLADRTTRFAEARELIEQAHQINPEDAAVLDSLGWVNYRQGQLDAAEALLRQALERFPDAEVAAHLGEVLWANGKQREAREVWAQALENTPDSPAIRSTVLRLTGSETL